MCKFCEEYGIMKEVSLESAFPVYFSVALIDHMIVGGKPKGRTTHYMKDGVGFPLNFCPECGKKLLED